jgi:DnaJ family protein A protein 2
MQMLGPGMYTQRTGPCDSCEGRGETIKESSKCKKCNGKKVKKDVKVFDITVDKGTPHGDRQVIHGEGDEIPGAEAGDIEVTIAVKPSKRFKRKGADLLMQKEVSLIEALTGVDFTFEHLDGRKIRVKSEPGDVIKPNSLMTLRDLGMPFHKKSY